MATRVGTVQFSKTASYKRLDAEFHLAIQSIDKELREVKGVYADEASAREKCIAIMTPFAPGDFIFLKPLLTGQAVGMSQKDIDSVVREYPYETLAMLKQNAPELMAKVKLLQEVINSQSHSVNDLMK